MKLEADFDRLNSGEVNSKALSVEVESDLCDKQVRIGFVTPMGKIYISEQLNLVNGKGKYPLPEGLLDGKGVLLAQLLISEEDSFAMKSPVCEFPVYASVDDMSCPYVSDSTLKSLCMIFDMLDRKSDVGHRHDERYYTKNKTDELLLEKSDISHNHNTIYLTVDEIQGMIDDKPLPVHEHDALYYRKNATNSLLTQKSDIDHTHSGMLTTDDVSDTVVESGTSGNWTYRKWSSGVAECWSRRTLKFDSDNVANSGIMQADGDVLVVLYTDVDLPESLFVAVPTMTCSATWDFGVWAQCNADKKTSTRIRIFCSQDTKATILKTGISVSIQVQGKWK